MKKTDRVSEFVSQLGTAPDSELDPRYTGFFLCFNEQRYYEAHDVLEDLWLHGPKDHQAGMIHPRHDPNYRFFKGLIQLAGAFVHLQKQRLRPEHPKDGKRTRPASRLFQLAADNLEGYRPVHMLCDVQALCEFCLQMKAEIEQSDFTRNPWDPENAPQLSLSGTHSFCS